MNLLTLFKRPPKQVVTWVKSEHKTWGDSIQWMNWEDRRIVGWTSPHPKKGDKLISEMKSGQMALFRFHSVEPCGEPPDMWFAQLEDVGYVLPPEKKLVDES